MKTYPAAIEELMLFLKQLPGVGKRGAERMVMDILDWDKSDIASFANAVLKIATDITFCPECGNCAEHGQLCSICSDLHPHCILYYVEFEIVSEIECKKRKRHHLAVR